VYFLARKSHLAATAFSNALRKTDVTVYRQEVPERDFKNLHKQKFPGGFSISGGEFPPAICLEEPLPLTPTPPLGPLGLDTSSLACALAILVSSELDVGKIFTGSTTNAVARSVCSS